MCFFFVFPGKFRNPRQIMINNKEEKAGCFAIIVLQMHCYYKCPRGAVGWSAVCDCGIS